MAEEAVIDNVGADVRAALDSLKSGGEAGAPDISTPPAEGMDSEAPEPAPEHGDAARRDERGRFAAKDQLDNSDKVVQDVDNQPEVREPETAIPPPHSLKAAVKANWSKYPPEVREEFVRLEQSVQAGKTEWASKAERLNRFDSLISPIKERLALSGVDEGTYVGRLIAADNLLTRDPVAGLAQIAQMYGVDLAQVGLQPQRAEQHPVIAQLTEKLSTLEQQLQQRTQADEQERLSEARREIEAFKAQNIYFEDVKGTIKALLETGQASDLQDAYDKATWANPEIRALILKAEREKEQASQQKAQHAQRARSAGVSVTGSPTPGGKANGSAVPNETVADTVRRSLAELSGRI
jgi:hypothetical protein